MTPTTLAHQDGLPFMLPAMKAFTRANVEMTTPEVIAPPDNLAIVELQASMKKALQGLSAAFDHIEAQSERLNQLASELKAKEQVRH